MFGSDAHRQTFLALVFDCQAQVGDIVAVDIATLPCKSQVRRDAVASLLDIGGFVTGTLILGVGCSWIHDIGSNAGSVIDAHG